MPGLADFELIPVPFRQLPHLFNCPAPTHGTRLSRAAANEENVRSSRVASFGDTVTQRFELGIRVMNPYLYPPFDWTRVVPPVTWN